MPDGVEDLWRLVVFIRLGRHDTCYAIQQASLVGARLLY